MPEKNVQKEPGKKPAPSKKPKPQQEVVVQISLSELHPFPDHPFQVREDASMQETAESVKEYGVLVPALARPREDGGYELIAGHRRKHACELAGLATMPVIVRDIDRDAATIIMVDSNLQRENILPSERAKAYKMKMEAIKRQGARTDLTSPKISAKFRSDDEVGQDAGVSGDTIRNYRRGVCCPLNGAVAAGGYGLCRRCQIQRERRRRRIRHRVSRLQGQRLGRQRDFSGFGGLGGRACRPVRSLLRTRAAHL